MDHLPHRVDRREVMTEQLNRFGIPYRFWDAIKETDGAVGLVKTMKQLLTMATSHGYKNVMILEDDAEFLIEPVPFLKLALPQLPKEYDLFYFGLSLLARPERISENILKISDCYSTHAMTYSLEGMRLILNKLNSVPDENIQPYDVFMRDQVLPSVNAYCTYPMLATQFDSYSDIQNSNPPWKKIMSQTYAMHTKRLKPMATETYPCHSGHIIDGVFPQVDETKFEVQNPNLINRYCDCGTFRYTEGKCETCQGDRWRIIWKEKDN